MVIVIIGILAAIALPSFLGQRVKAQDAAAQSDAANGVVQVESCFVDRQSYVGCTLADSGLPSAVRVTSQTEDSYTVRSVSESGNAFSVAHRNGRPDSRTCTVTGGSAVGACDASLQW